MNLERNSVIFVIFSLIAIKSSANGFFDAYFYMIPPQGEILICDSRNNDTVLSTLVDQPSVVEFASELPTEIQGYVQVANPINACKHVDPPPDKLPDIKNINFDLSGTQESSSPPPSKSKQWILLASKSECPYKTKIELADAAGFEALIIFNVGSNETEVIGLAEEQANVPIDFLIPSFFIGSADGQRLKDTFSRNYNKRYFVRILSKQPRYKDVIYYLMWITLGVFVLLLSLCFVKPLYECVLQPWVQQRYRHRRRNLLTRAVSSLAIVEWKDDLVEKYETCVICMEIYGDAELLRILPCNHGFHTACIDSWLLKVRRVCPICKEKITYSSCWEDDSDSDISEGNYFTDIAYEPLPNNSTNHNGMEHQFTNWESRQFIHVGESDTISDQTSLDDSIGVSSLRLDSDCQIIISASYVSTTVSVHERGEGRRSPVEEARSPSPEDHGNENKAVDSRLF